MAERGLHWHEEAERSSVCDIYIREIIKSNTDKRMRNIKGRSFPDATGFLYAFADPCGKIVYMPNWYKNYFEPNEYQWIVFHEVGHIKYNDKSENPLNEGYRADEYAVGIQKRIGFGVCALTKISDMEMRRARILGRGDPEINSQIIQRINRLKGLNLLW